MFLRSVMMMVMVCMVTAEWNESYFIREVLLKNYDKLIRPVLNPSDPVNVSISIGIKSFIQLDMKKQILVSFGWLTVNWYDRFLTWDLRDNPVKLIHLKYDMIWRPELVVFNTVSNLDQFEDQEIKITVENDGKVTWYPGGLFQTFCSIDISYYPWDMQTCSVDIIPWTSTESVLNGTFNDPAFEVSSTEHHPEWSLVRTEPVYVLRQTNFWVLRFNFTLKRKVLFYIINIILPIVLLSLMNCLVFLLPEDSGEKMTVSVTVFLSFAVFMTLINESLPQNSDSICVFSVYVATQIFLSVCTIMLAAIIVFIFDKEQKLPTASLHPPHPSSSTKRRGSPHSPKLSFEPKTLMSSSVTLESLCSSSNSSITSNSDVLATNGYGAPSKMSSSGATETVHDDGEAQQLYQQSLSWSTAWHLLQKTDKLSPLERRLLSRKLDKTCFVLTVATNICSCLIFALLMIFT